MIDITSRASCSFGFNLKFCFSLVVISILYFVFQVSTLEMLIQAFDEEDGDMARKALNSPFIKHMDVEYAKLARSLPIPKTSQVRKILSVVTEY